MALANFIALLGGTVCALIAALQLLTTFTTFDIDYVVDTPLARTDRMLANVFASSDSLRRKAAAGQQYLLGVGKADITG